LQPGDVGFNAASTFSGSTLERAKYIPRLFLTLHLDILIAGYCSVSTKASLFLGFSINGL
jgi:hypothetical protein